jgi:DNA-binding transcriptional LysR family regulator
MINTELDFKLLSVFQALIENRQVSAAARQLGIAQPSVSRALTKLRQHFDDPLFVRTQSSMEPTPLAIELSPSIDEMLQLYETKLSGDTTFDPATSKRSFHVACSEVGHVLLFSRLMSRIFELAPYIQLHAVPLGLQALTKELESGETSMAFGPYPKLYAGIHERTLYKERYICLVRCDHPKIGSHLSLEQFQSSNHIIISAQGLGHHHEQIESQIKKSCPENNLKVVTHNFLTAALLAEKTDCIVTLPSGAAQALDHQQRLRALVPPIDLPGYDIKLYWHERYHHDPSHIWMRELIYDLFNDTKGILEQHIT